MIKLFFASILSTIYFISFGQHEFGIKINGGLSKITANLNLSNGSTRYSFAPSGQVGLFYNINFGKKSQLTVEPLFSQIGSKEKMQFNSYLDNLGNPVEKLATINIDYHISYFSIPIYYGFKIKGLTLNLGLQTSLAIANRLYYVSNTPNGGSIALSKDEEFTFKNKGKGKSNIDFYDFGLRSGLVFNLNKRFAIEATYYYGINNILGTNAPSKWNWKVQQITIGLRYTFLKRVKDNKPPEEKRNSESKI